MTDATGGLESTFEQIGKLAASCRFKDCSHTGESGCAVTDALEQGQLDRHAYENYLKLQREKDHFESTLAERRKKDKDFGKMVKNVKSDMKKYKSNR
jgi:ribosome biogenesis GTPase